MTEPTITCPNCKTEIRLTESLAAPLIAATRQQFERQLAQKDEDYARREQGVRDKEKQIAEARRTLDEQVADQVAAQLKAERARVVAEESKKARQATEMELEGKARELAELQDVLKSRDEKLAEAQKAQAELIKKQRELDDARRELELTVEKRVQDGLTDVRTQAKKEAEDEQKLKVMEKEQTIAAMQKQIEDLKRRAEQGSQQLQGEVQELELENLLRAKFPFDSIEPVPKGEFGGDVLHRVVSQGGQPCGTMLWEFKRTKNWSDGWLVKLRDDQRTAKAEIAVIVSQILPKGVETFEMVEGVWVTHPRAALPVAMILRQSLLELALARQTTEGQQTKTEMVYQYLTGPRFRQRVEAIVEAFSSMQEDLDKERKAIMKQWAKREEQIERVMGATVGMYGDLQGIAGKSLQEIEGLSLQALDASVAYSGNAEE
ncbi:MAG: DUF2130 domain-containing protein [Hydrogenophilales bacterium CG03_land_8_20_14_0_80_62_28]|nr:DUF2130 domain-containing protein [Betaproteobacteria bacterium]OIO76668.1 MAG: hypothetical protein AUJ86_11250 [Hydrogenophilaceae bacterium CG1_02_62_390]PIV23613.1 MAG: DUF2130 domain-containing protein [Hydrogenophilales bacterium CG03_land_8_20_14_0_80_62_28]PIW39412.1 MAG: DUF2130 domain-containing protein [Hydrogenophilales bacterium CG15_BIG_FIL_POST_REV_8_21_14_020_62_31]PIW72133.1 MAG: DUF2130 domain-containing protein [Hydrogenophilales bacterium CG12_big_fil_rev_8_21_14_0_65_61_